jgi:hypothetical protein
MWVFLTYNFSYYTCVSHSPLECYIRLPMISPLTLGDQ